MKPRRTHHVNDVARLAGVSVRALHHYDAIGLLVPKRRTSAGYRVYDDDDLLRLQQILIGRELGLSLEEVRRSLDDPAFDREKGLLAQREQLRGRARKTEEMIRAVDAALAQLKRGDIMDTKALFEGMDAAKLEEEARERWGRTDSYEESMRRTKGYTAEDWKRHSEEQAAIYTGLVAAMSAGKLATSEEAMDLAERHRQSIDRWFYPCSLEIHRGLADMYENDARFAENIDRHGAGLTAFLAAAIRANAARVISEGG